MPQPVRRVFISHASSDKSLASAIVTYLLSSLTVHDKKEILCTSLPGHELVPGTKEKEGIREAIREAQIIFGLLTPNSLERQAVMMELGAAWAFEKHFVPLLFGLPFDKIPDWIRVHAIKLDDSLSTFPLLHDRITPVAQLVADHTTFPLKDAAALGGATDALLRSLTAIQSSTAPVAPLPPVGDPKKAGHGASLRKVKALVASLRMSESRKSAMPYITPEQAGVFNNLLREAKQAGGQTTAQLLPVAVAGPGATFGLTATPLSGLIGALEMLAVELDD